MSEETATPKPIEAEPAAMTGKPGLHPETNKKISSMADAFRNAMSGADSAAPKPPDREAEVVTKSEPVVDLTPPDSTGTESPSNESKPVSRSAADFKLIKQERDAAKQQVAELLSKVSSYEDLEGLKDNYEKLKAEHEEMSNTLSLTNLERHPKFRDQFIKPVETQIDRAKAYVPEEKREQLAKILRMPVGDTRADALDDLVGELPSSRQAYLQNIVSRIDEISYERDQQLSQSKESYEKMVQEENLVSEKKSTERTAALEKSFNAMLNQAQDQIGIYQLREGDEEWNHGVRERVALAKKILMEQNSFEDAATAALWAASGGALVEQNAALVEHNRRLNTELEELRGAEPQNVGKRTTAPQAKRNGSSSFSDRVMGELKGMGVGL